MQRAPLVNLRTKRKLNPQWAIGDPQIKLSVARWSASSAR